MPAHYNTRVSFQIARGRSFVLVHVLSCSLSKLHNKTSFFFQTDFIRGRVKFYLSSTTRHDTSVRIFWIRLIIYSDFSVVSDILVNSETFVIACESPDFLGLVFQRYVCIHRGDYVCIYVRICISIL